MTVHVRDARSADLDAIAAIYNDQGVATMASYDLEPVSVENRRIWHSEHLAAGYPVLVATRVSADAGDTEEVLGFATYGSFRLKLGYRYTVEHSVYVRADQHGRGVGRALMTELIARARAARLHAMIGVVGADNTDSRAFHVSLGFVESGTLPEVGTKFGRWLSIVLPVLLLTEDVPAD